MQHSINRIRSPVSCRKYSNEGERRICVRCSIVLSRVDSVSSRVALSISLKYCEEVIHRRFEWLVGSGVRGLSRKLTGRLVPA